MSLLQYPSAPWEEEREGGQCELFDSPADFVVKVTNYDFQARATAVVFSNLAADTVLKDVLPLEGDQLGQVLRVMGRLGRHYTNSLVKSLTIWRTSMNPLSMMPLDISGKKKAQAYFLTQRNSKKTQSGISEDRMGLVVDYIFATALLPVIKHYNGSNIDSQPLEQIEEAILKCIVAEAIQTSGPSEAHLANQRHNIALFREIFGYISKYRVQFICDPVFQYIDENFKNATVVNAVLEGSRTMQCNPSPEYMEGNFKFLNKLATNWKTWVVKNKNKDQRTAFCEYFGHVLKHAIPASQGDQSTQFRELVKKLGEEVDALVKKSKGSPFLFPLVSTIMCLHPADYFVKKFDPLLETLLVPQKDSQSRSLAFESIYTVIQAACTKFDDGNQARLHKAISQVGKFMFPTTGKKVPFLPNLVQMEQIAHVAEILAVKDADAVFKDILTPLLSSNIAEAHATALLAAARISLHGQGLEKIPTSSVCDSAVLKSVNSYRLQTLVSAHATEEEQKISGKHLGLVSKCQASVFCSTHNQVGTVMMHSNAKEPPANTAMIALKAAVFSLYACMPASNHMEHLLNLCRYTIHADLSFQRDALAVIKHIVIHRPHFRADMCHSFGQFLPMIPNAMGDLATARLRFYVELLKLWRDEEDGEAYPPRRDYEPQPQSSSIDPNRICGVSMLFLCSANASQRKLAYELIELARTIHDRTSTSDVPPKDLFGIIAAYEDDIVGQSTYFRYELRNDPDKLDTEKAKKHTLKQMLALTTPRDEEMWTHALGGLASYAAEEEPDLGKIIWTSVADHVSPAMGFDRLATTDNGFLEAFCYYRNLLTVAVASSNHGNPATLFRAIIPNIRNDMKERHRLAAETALAFVPQGSFATLITESAALDRQAFVDDKSGKLRLKKCNLMAALSYIYRVIVENMRVGYLASGGNGKPIFHQIELQLEHFPGMVSIKTTDNTLEWQFRRYNLSMLLYRAFLDLSYSGKTAPEVFGPKLYNASLEFLSETSGCTHMVVGSAELAQAQYKQDKGAYLPHVDAEQDATKKAAMRAHFDAQARAVEYMGQRGIAAGFGNPQDPMGTRLTFVWFTNLYAAGDALSKSIADAALLNVLRFNPPMLANMIERGYGYENLEEAAAYAMTVAKSFTTGDICMLPQVALTFAVFKVADADERVRAAAHDMAQLVFSKLLGKSYDTSCRTSVYDALIANLEAVYQRLADENSALAFDVVEEVFQRFRMVNNEGRERLLRFVKPWIVHLNLADAELERTAAFLEQMTLISLDYDRLFLQHVQDMWNLLGSANDNAISVINFLVSGAVAKRNEAFVTVSRKVSLLMSRCRPEQVSAHLLQELVAQDKVTFPEDGQPPLDEFAKVMAENAMKAMKDSWEKDAKYKFEQQIGSPPLSRSDVSLVLLLDIASENHEHIIAAAPRILHCCLMNLDDPHPTLRSMSKRVLFTIVNILCEGRADAKQALLKALDVDSAEALYERDSIRCSNKSPLATIVAMIKEMCGASVSSDIEAIVSTATAQIYGGFDDHRKIRGMQIVAALQCKPSKSLLAHLMKVLTENMGESMTPLALEAVHSLRTMIEYSNGPTLVAHPQFLWLAIAFLFSPEDAEYVIGAELLIAVLDKIDFSEEAAQDMVSASFPKDWMCQFKGLQTLVMKGLLNPTTMKMTSHRPVASTHERAGSMEMLQGFTLLECDALVELGPTRLVDNLVGQMPWLAMHVGNVGVGEKKAAASIATVCNLLQQPDLGQVFRNYADDTYTDANEFLDDFARLFCASNLKGHEIRALTFLCETRFEGPKELHVPSMQTARALMTYMDFSNKKVAQSVLVHLFVLKDSLADDDWESVAGVFDAVLVNCGESFDFSNFHDVSSLSKQLDKFGKRTEKSWGSSETGRTALLDAMGKVMLSLGEEALGTVTGEEQDARDEKALFPIIEPGRVFSKAYNDKVLKEGGSCSFAEMPNPSRKVLRLRDAEDVHKRKASRSDTLRMEQPAPSPRRLTLRSSGGPSPRVGAPSKLGRPTPTPSDETPPPPPARGGADEMPPPPPARGGATSAAPPMAPPRGPPPEPSSDDSDDDDTPPPPPPRNADAGGSSFPPPPMLSQQRAAFPPPAVEAGASSGDPRFPPPPAEIAPAPPPRR